MTTKTETTKSKYKIAHTKTKRIQTRFDNPSKAKQAFKDECNINNIMNKYQETGLIDHMNSFKAQQGDFSEVLDYQSVMNQVIDARESFLDLPSTIRKEFDNDPTKFLDFVNDPSNKDKMIELGLAKAPRIQSKPIPESDSQTLSAEEATSDAK
ncbi:internal scaffolding protein [Microviridae sp.]|nr:internal scaffolding protein [Microviridae sp.]